MHKLLKKNLIKHSQKTSSLYAQGVTLPNITKVI